MAFDEKAGHAVLDDLAQAAHRGGNDRRPERLCLESDEAEALGERGDDAHVRHRVVHGELLVRHGAHESNMVAEPDTRRVALEAASLAAASIVRAVAAVVAGDDHGKVREIASAS